MKNYQAPFKKFKGWVIPLTIFFFILLVISISNNSFESSWPYLLMSLVILLTSLFTYVRISQKKVSFFFISLVLFLFGMQFLFYFVIPDYYDYQPITVPGLMMIYQLHGKVQIFYSPDYVKQGDTIKGFISACSNDYKNCKDLDDYNLTAYFNDKSGTKHIIFENKGFNNKTQFEIDYMGHPIEMEMKYEDLIYDFILPKKSIWQTFWMQYNRHPIVGMIFLISSIMTIISFITILKTPHLFRKIKRTYVKEVKRVYDRIKDKKL